MIAVETPNVRERLVQLIELQVLYNRLYLLRQKEGDLPQQIIELRDQALATQRIIQRYQVDIRQYDAEIRNLHVSNDTHADQIQKLERSLMQVRSNEHLAQISAEIEELRLGIEKNKRLIRTLTQRVEGLRDALSGEESKLEALEQGISEKEGRLQFIQQETEAQRQALQVRIDTLAATLQAEAPRLYQLFSRRQRSLREGKALVPVLAITTSEKTNDTRACCSGCFTLIPRQLEWEISRCNQLFLCESCGRFLVDAELFKEVADRMP